MSINEWFVGGGVSGEDAVVEPVEEAPAVDDAPVEKSIKDPARDVLDRKDARAAAPVVTIAEAVASAKGELIKLKEKIAAVECERDECTEILEDLGKGIAGRLAEVPSEPTILSEERDELIARVARGKADPRELDAFDAKHRKSIAAWRKLYDAGEAAVFPLRERVRVIGAKAVIYASKVKELEEERDEARAGFLYAEGGRLDEELFAAARQVESLFSKIVCVGDFLRRTGIPCTFGQNFEDLVIPQTGVPSARMEPESKFHPVVASIVGIKSAAEHYKFLPVEEELLADWAELDLHLPPSPSGVPAERPVVVRLVVSEGIPFEIDRGEPEPPRVITSDDTEVFA